MTDRVTLVVREQRKKKKQIQKWARSIRWKVLIDFVISCLIQWKALFLRSFSCLCKEGGAWMEEETGRPSIRRLLAASCWLFLSFHRLLLFLLLFFFLPERAREPQPAARLISPTRPHFHVVIAQSVGALSTHRSVSLSGYSAPLRVCARATFPRSDRRRSASDSRQWVVLAAAPAQLAASSSSSSSSSFSPSPVWSLLDSQPTQIAVIVLVRDVLLLVFVFLYFVFFFYQVDCFQYMFPLIQRFQVEN